MDFITGNKFKKISNYSFDEYGFNVVNPPKNNETTKYFVKIDFVHKFFELEHKNPFILITHNGDIPVNENHLSYLNNPNLISWYGQNVNISHPKLKSIPIGIANEQWPHGNEALFQDIINSNIQKEKLVYVNFDINTNINERTHCLNQIHKNGLSMETKLPFEGYLKELARSYFVISPNGNGIDCHKTWEALYLKTIPIVTKSINIEFYKNLPIVILNTWDDFNVNLFTEEYYSYLWSDFKPSILTTKKYFNYV